jgi:hypothetical protein
MRKIGKRERERENERGKNGGRGKRIDCPGLPGPKKGQKWQNQVISGKLF